MRVVKHFSVYPTLPIKLNEVADFIVECGYARAINFYPIDCDPRELAGMLRLWESTGVYVPAGEVGADIVYSVNLPLTLQRLVVAKELLHICDAEALRAGTQAQVSRLITEFSYPPDLIAELGKISPQLTSDRAGILPALAVLIPEEAIDALRPAYSAGTIGDEEIAALAEVPDYGVKLVMSDLWPGVLESLK